MAMIDRYCINIEHFSTEATKWIWILVAHFVKYSNPNSEDKQNVKVLSSNQGWDSNGA